jgi:phage shock protein PspC (stress-responsive transcriptional regulator)
MESIIRLFWGILVTIIIPYIILAIVEKRERDSNR